MNDPTMEDLRRIVQDHVEEDRASFVDLKAASDRADADRRELIELVKPMHRELVGTDEKQGSRERLRALEKTVQNMKWIVGVTATALIYTIIERLVPHIGAR